MKQIRLFFEKEIFDGLINQEKLEKKIAAFLEFANAQIKAFDIKTGEKKRVAFNDAVIISFTKDGVKIPVLIKSPRFINGKYVAKSIIYGSYDPISKKPMFFLE